ncbi:MAG: cyclic nucleotide-binding domain-containing protein [Actinomycetota bacterium]
MNNLAAIRRVLRNPAVAASEAAYALFAVVVHGTWLAGLVFAFNQGGVAEAGVVAALVLLPGAVAAPLLSVLADRTTASRALTSGFIAEAAAYGGAGLLMFADGSPVTIYVLWAIGSAIQTMITPTLLAALPSLVRSPTDFAAANAVLGLVERLGILVGPIVAGFILFRASPGMVFLIAAALLVVAALLALLVTPADGEVVRGDPGPASPFADVTSGLRLLRDQPQTRLLVILLASVLIIFGALDVAFITIAVEQLGQDEGAVGILAAAIGVGGIIGAALTFSLIGRRRLTTPIALGLLAVAVPIMLVGTLDSFLLVVLVLAVTGLGRPILEVAGRTLIQGLSSEDTMAGIFGLLEGLTVLALAAGALGYSIADATFGTGWALFGVGAILPLFLLIRFRSLREIDRSRPEVDLELLDLMRNIPIFAPLPAFQVEQLLVTMQPMDLPADNVVFHEGDEGELLYVVTDGNVVVELPDREVHTGRGGFFGEIALIRDEPRMATVRAGATGVRTYTLERNAFLTAISGVARSRARAHHEVGRRLGEPGT